MQVNEKLAVEHGLKVEEYKLICELLKRTPNLTGLAYFQPCGTSIARINLLDFI